MTDAQALPENTAASQAAIFELKAKRPPLLEAIEGAAARRRANAALAELGNAAARSELERAEADETQARAAVVRLDEAVDVLETHHRGLVEAEHEELVAIEAERVSELIDDLLALDDEIDATCKRLRAMLMERTNILAVDLQGYRGGFRGFAAREVGHQLINYFDFELRFLPVERNYARLRPIADIDAAEFNRPSPAMLARGLTDKSASIARRWANQGPVDPRAAPMPGMMQTGVDREGNPRFAFIKGVA
jgi:hypothetical protein